MTGFPGGSPLRPVPSELEARAEDQAARLDGFCGVPCADHDVRRDVVACTGPFGRSVIEDRPAVR
jgi:hypothetical protein